MKPAYPMTSIYLAWNPDLKVEQAVEYCTTSGLEAAVAHAETLWKRRGHTPETQTICVRTRDGIVFRYNVVTKSSVTFTATQLP